VFPTPLHSTQNSWPADVQPCGIQALLSRELTRECRVDAANGYLPPTTRADQPCERILAEMSQCLAAPQEAMLRGRDSAYLRRDWAHPQSINALTMRSARTSGSEDKQAWRITPQKPE